MGASWLKCLLLQALRHFCLVNLTWSLQIPPLSTGLKEGKKKIKTPNKTVCCLGFSIHPSLFLSNWYVYVFFFFVFFVFILKDGLEKDPERSTVLGHKMATEGWPTRTMPPLPVRKGRLQPADKQREAGGRWAFLVHCGKCRWLCQTPGHAQNNSR